RDAPYRAPLAPRTRPTEEVPRCRPPARPAVPRRGDAGVDPQVGSREPAVVISAGARGTGDTRSPTFGHPNPDPTGPPRTRANRAPGRDQLAGVPPSAGREHPGL